LLERKLTDDQAREIRERYANGESSTSLHQQFKIGKSTILAVIAGYSYKTAGGPIKQPIKRPRLDPNAGWVERAKEMRSAGRSFEVIARRLKMTSTKVRYAIDERYREADNLKSRLRHARKRQQATE
jgi:hypothetical protein